MKTTWRCRFFGHSWGEWLPLPQQERVKLPPSLRQARNERHCQRDGCDAWQWTKRKRP
jgi:hypothetical protein